MRRYRFLQADQVRVGQTEQGQLFVDVALPILAVALLDIIGYYSRLVVSDSDGADGLAVVSKAPVIAMNAMSA